MSPETLTVNRYESVLAQQEEFKSSLGLDYELAPFSPTEQELQLKRFFDVLLSIMGILALLPFMAVLALCVKLTSPGPIIYKSLRIGQNKKPFYMFKFRTMVQNAHAMRQDLAVENDLTEGLFKLKNDTRVTPIGAVFRKYSLDEFPQLFNVLFGDMSLVGPRPYIPEESDLFREPYTIRFQVMPGMTGPWQVSGRSNLSFEELCNLEFKYVRNWSFLGDASILFNTIPAVLMKRGAY